MTDYNVNLAADTKAPCTIWDLPEQQTRFVTQNHPGLTLPSGWTLYEGCQPKSDVTSKLDVLTGKLTVGGCGFTVPDYDAGVSAWLRTHDATLCLTQVTRRQGFVNGSESNYLVSYWVVEDFKVDDAYGAGYEFVLANVLKAMTRGIYETVEGESYQLAADLAPTTTTITLQKTPKNVWREPGYCVLHHRDKYIYELVAYQTIGGTGSKDLQSCTRRYYAVGDAALTFPADNSDIWHVWVKRGNPVTTMLQWLTTTPGSGGLSSHAPANKGFETWTNPASDCDGFTEYLNGIGTISRDTGRVGGYSAKLSRSGSPGELHLDASGAAYTPSKWVQVLVYARASTEGAYLGVRIYNSTRSRYLGADKVTWQVGTYTHLFRLTESWELCVLAGLIDAAHAAGDTIVYGFFHSGNTGVDVWVDDSDFIGPYDTEPNGPYDLGNGDGVGEFVRCEYLDVHGIEAVRNSYWPEPTFVADAKTAGTATLFVERQGIDDLKRYLEDNLLRPFALFPAVDYRERLTIETYFRASPTPVEVFDNWDKRTFKASQWGRNYNNRINNLRIRTDFGIAEGSHAYNTFKVQETSRQRYGFSKEVSIDGRGCRSGRLGFPDYGSLSDVATAASRLMLECANPSTELTVRTFFRYKDTSLTDAVAINIPNVPNMFTGERGLVGELFLVTQRKVDHTKGFCELTLRLRRPVQRPAFVAPDTVASTYGTATTLDKQYCYLTNNDEDRFSTGEEAYTVIS